MNPPPPRHSRPHPRRRYTAIVLGSVATALGAGALSRNSHGATKSPLHATPRDFEGPYRPPRDTPWGGVNLMTEHAVASPGSPLVFAGQVIDTWGRPQAGLQVQVWQANSSGRYDYHPGETPGHGAPDQAFRGHGQARTDSGGWFAFRTIRPAGYRRTLFGFLPWTFVPHIHVAVRAADRDLLVTQADLDRVAAGRIAPESGTQQTLMQSDAMRQLIAATGEAVVEAAGTAAGAQLVRFDVVLAARA